MQGPGRGMGGGGGVGGWGLRPCREASGHLPLRHSTIHHTLLSLQPCRLPAPHTATHSCPRCARPKCRSRPCRRRSGRTGCRSRPSPWSEGRTAPRSTACSSEGRGWVGNGDGGQAGMKSTVKYQILTTQAASSAAPPAWAAPGAHPAAAHPQEPANSGEASAMAATSQPVPRFLYW